METGKVVKTVRAPGHGGVHGTTYVPQTQTLWVTALNIQAVVEMDVKDNLRILRMFPRAATERMASIGTTVSNAPPDSRCCSTCLAWPTVADSGSRTVRLLRGMAPKPSAMRSRRRSRRFLISYVGH